MNAVSLRVIVDEAPIVAIVRRPKVDPIRCVEHLFQQGIRLVEITMDSVNAADVLKHFQSRVPANCLLGAGTVTSVDLAETALEAGASFIVTPNLDLEVIRTARSQGVPVMPGAMTPTEILGAAKAGGCLRQSLSCQRSWASIFSGAPRPNRGHSFDGFRRCYAGECCRVHEIWERCFRTRWRIDPKV